MSFRNALAQKKLRKQIAQEKDETPKRESKQEKKKQTTKTVPPKDPETKVVTKPKNEIDDIFANKKAAPKRVAEDTKVKKPSSAKNFDDDFFDSRGLRDNKKAKTTDGFKVYSEEALGLDKNLSGGGTNLCPFDCDCCF